MNFSLSNNSKYKKEAYEIKVKANRLGDIFDFMKENPEKRYNIQLNLDEIELNKFKEQLSFVDSVTKNYTISCNNFTAIKTLFDNKIDIPAYLDIPIYTWEEFVGLRDIGVSDIVIDGQLLFSCSEVILGKNTGAKEVKIRCKPNVSTSGYWVNDKITSAFIRPEDLVIYADCIDIIEFANTGEDVLYEIYKRGDFVDNIDKLFPNIGISIVNSLLPPEFGHIRSNCKQKCKIPGKICNYCINAVSATEKLTKFFEETKERKKE